MKKMDAMINPSRNDGAIDTAESFIAPYRPETIRSKCFPVVTIALSNR